MIINSSIWGTRALRVMFSGGFLAMTYSKLPSDTHPPFARVSGGSTTNFDASRTCTALPSSSPYYLPAFSPSLLLHLVPARSASYFLLSPYSYVSCRFYALSLRSLFLYIYALLILRLPQSPDHLPP